MYILIIIIFVILYKIFLTMLPITLKKFGIELLGLKGFFVFQKFKIKKKIKSLFLKYIYIDIENLSWKLQGIFKILIEIEKIEIKIDLNFIELECYEMFGKSEDNKKILLENLNFIKSFINHNHNFLVKKKGKVKNFKNSKAMREVSIFKVCLNFLLRIIMIILLKCLSIKIKHIKFDLTELSKKKEEEKLFLKVNINSINFEFNYFGDERFIILSKIKNLELFIKPNSHDEKNKSKLTINNLIAKFKIPASHRILFSMLNSGLSIKVKDLFGVIKDQTLFDIIVLSEKFLFIQKIRKYMRINNNLIDYSNRFKDPFLEVEDIILVN